MKKIRIKIIVSVIMIVMVVSFSLVINTDAKYRDETIINNLLGSKDFNFSISNYLEEDTVVNNWGGEPLDFEVYNYDKDGISDFDINYEVTCNVLNEDVDVTCNILDTFKNTYVGVINNEGQCFNVDLLLPDLNQTECLNQGFTYKEKKSKDVISFSIEGELLTEDIQLEIIIKSIYPYTKEVKGNIVLRQAENITDGVSLIHTSAVDYERVTLYNVGTDTKNVKLKWNPTKASISKFNNLYNITADGNIESLNLVLEPNVSYSFIFYKANKDLILTTKDFVLEIE